MRIVYSDRHALHDPSFFLVRGQRKPSAEQPERATRLLEGARSGGHDVVAPLGLGMGPVAAIHTPDYLQFLATAHAAWKALPDAAEEIIPNIHPQRRASIYPRSIVGRAGWHQADTACPIGAGTWEAALASADVAASAAQMVLEGAGAAYALCRPPGHHAYADQAGGFCFLNNSAIAAQMLRRKHDRVAILDIDVHHGNGTQGIFWRRPDVLTVSIHADPMDYYPFFWGHASERGEGDGEGYNLNLPLPLGTGDDAWRIAIDQGIERLQAFAPCALVVALGLDAHEDDPLKGFKVTTAGFAHAARHIAKIGLPTVLVQEGGYLSPALGANLASFLGGYAGSAHAR